MSYRIGVNGYWRLERLPDYQAVSVAYDRFYSLNLELNYEYLERSLEPLKMRWVSPGISSHRRTSSGVTSSRASSEASPSDSCFRSTTPHCGCARRREKPLAQGNESLANFYFGGFGNNWVDHGDIWQYRYPSSFPGLPSIVRMNWGDQLRKADVEWNLPLCAFGGSVSRPLL